MESLFTDYKIGLANVSKWSVFVHNHYNYWTMGIEPNHICEFIPNKTE